MINKKALAVPNKWPLGKHLAMEKRGDPAHRVSLFCNCIAKPRAL